MTAHDTDTSQPKGKTDRQRYQRFVFSFWKLTMMYPFLKLVIVLFYAIGAVNCETPTPVVR